MARRFSSPNPPSSKSQNPHLRTPEQAFGYRIISGDNPTFDSTTLHRIPLDLPQRISGTKENGNRESRSRYRSRSPSTPSSTKGTKNFMAPTISASSKVISSSSKRRILSERNDAPQLHSRASLISASYSEMGSGYQNVSDDSNLKKSDSEFCKPDQTIPTPSPPSPPSPPKPTIIAPLDADPPAAPPYDLKRNFLSPRPQFLHYKPNPRIHRFNQFLDDSLSSESCDDVDGDEDEDSLLSEEIHCSEENHDRLLQEDEVEEDQVEVEVEEAEVVEDGEETEIRICNVIQSRGGFSRLRSLYKPRILPVVLMVVAACFLFPAIDTPVILSTESPPFPKPLAIDTPGMFLCRITGFANLNLKQVSNLLHQQYLSSVHYFSRPRTEEGNVGAFFHYRLLNSTAQEEESFPGFPVMKDADVAVVVSQEKEQQSEDIPVEADVAVVVSSREEEQEQEEVTEEENAGIDMVSVEEEAEAEVLVEVSEDPTGVQPEVVEVSDDPTGVEPEPEPEMVEVSDDTTGVEPEVVEVSDDPTGIEQEPEPEVEGGGLEEHVSSEHVEEEIDQFEEEEEDRNNSDGDSEGRFEDDGAEEETKTTPSTATTLPTKSTAIVGLSSVIAAALATSLYLLAQKKKEEQQQQEQPNPSTAIVVDHEKKMPPSSPSSPKNMFVSNQTRQTEQSSTSISDHHHPFDAVEKMRESSSGSSEMSSTHYHGTASNGESLSFERREDSTVSSATYGSFTTYEKLPGAKGGGIKDEALTPVRRSSRIRSKVTSPNLK